jgi:hypothetical protein
METIQQKYNRLRPQIEDGDLILFHGTKALAKIIQWCDDSYYNHIGVVVEQHGALFIVDANGDGVQADRLSQRINSYKRYADFTILKPLASKDEINYAMRTLLKRSDGNTIKYDYNNGLKELFNRKFKPEFKINEDTEKRAICSSNVYQYAITLEIVTDEFKSLRIAFPQDYIRFLNKVIRID